MAEVQTDSDSRRWSTSLTRLAVALVVLCAGMGAWLWVSRQPVWDGALSIGFRDSPPFYFASPSGQPEGLAVDVMNAAAARLGLTLRWVQVREPTQDALKRGHIDVWPTLPLTGASALLHVTEPWLESEFFLLHREGMTITSPFDLRGYRISASPPESPEGQLARRAFPGTQLVASPTPAGMLQLMCNGEADAAFISGRQGLALLMARPPDCESVHLGFVQVPGVSIAHGIGSTVAAAKVADRLRSEVENMAADGTLAQTHAAWSFTTANEIRIVYALQQARLRNRLAIYGVAALALALALALWEITRSRQARRLAEDHSRQQERYRILFERNLAGVYRTTADGRILDCNDAFARMLGCRSREELLTRKVWDFYPDRQSRETMMVRLAREHTLTNQELVLRRADGRTVVLLESTTMIDPGGGEPPFFEGTVLDITRQRELEDQYRQAQKLESIGRLAGGVAHDFNNTLTAINGYTELVLSSLDESDPNCGMMREIQKAGQHAESLTRQLLAFSRRQHLQPEVINLNTVISETRTLLRRVIGEDVELLTDLSPDLGNVKADPGQLQQVVMNLAVNARDAMPGGGRLTIATANAVIASDADAEPGTSLGACVRLTVADTGPGMDEETRRRAFEPFFTTKERGKGTGLGLATVYGIVKQSGGHVRIRSAPGEGATFEIDLPTVDEPVKTRESAGGRPALGGTETILVVEDQDDVRRIVVESLMRYGYNVLDAGAGEVALDLCRRYEGEIHLLLADVVMPGMTGPAAANACQAVRPGLKVLFMSGYPDNMLRREIGPDTPVAYIQKPFTPAHLATRIREVLG